MKDYLVIVSLPYGGGSWARGSDRDQTIERCKRILKSDWKSLFKFKKGLVVKANVLDATGFDNFEWGHMGITADGKPFTGPIEVVDITY